MGKTSLVAHLLESYPLTARPTRLRDVISAIMVEKDVETNRSVAAEKAEAWEASVDRILRSKLNEMQKEGRPARVSYNSSDSAFVQGACFIEPSDPPDIQEQKRRRSRLGSYLKLIQGLDADEFELLCRRLLRLFGASSPNLTRRTGDDGIDFYGKVRGEYVFFAHDLQPTIQRQLSIWLVGQAKQFGRTQAGTREIRDLVGAVELGRSGTFSTEASPYPNLKLRACDPVFAMLVTGGTLSGRAWSLIRKSGVIGIDGELLATFLVDRVSELGSNPTVDQFREWLAE